MIYLNIAIGIFTFAIFLAIIGLDELARYFGLASAVFAFTFVVLSLSAKLFNKSKDS
jgi:hypothetical protein